MLRVYVVLYYAYIITTTRRKNKAFFYIKVLRFIETIILELIEHASVGT